MIKYLSIPRVHKFFVIVFAFSTLSLIAGCAGSVVGDAENVLSVIELAVSTLSGILAFIPGAAAFAAPLNEVGTTLTTLQELFAEYKTNATETVYQKIQDFVQLLEANLQKLVNPEGVSTAVVTKVNTIVSAILTQVGTWLALITQLKAAPAPAASANAIEPANAVVAKPEIINTPKPSSAKALHAQLKTIVETATGEETTDWAFKTASRF